MSRRAVPPAAISWAIPGMPDIEARFGPTTGGDEAWEALVAALADGWVVRVVAVRAPAALSDALDRRARDLGCYTRIARDERLPHAWWAWWPPDQAARGDGARDALPGRRGERARRRPTLGFRGALTCSASTGPSSAGSPT